MNILSLFDGIGVSYQAANAVFGAETFNYYASEKDETLVDFTINKCPNIKHLGTVERLDVSALPNIDILTCGSPCQDLSKAGKRVGLTGVRSALFWDAVAIKDALKPRYWIFENVKPTKETENIMSTALGCLPHRINSRFFTKQNRLRLYWTNIDVLPLPAYVPCEEYYSHKCFGVRRITRHLPTLTRGIMTNAWATYDKHDFDYKDIDSCFTPINDWSVFEQAQGLVPGYTATLPNVKRRLAIANAFTQPVIEHLFKSTFECA